MDLIGILRRYHPGADIALAVGIIGLLAMLVVPLPAILLDVGLSVSLTGSVLVLMVAIFLTTPLEFTSFPTLLLLTTLLRLSLNVATTRLILSHGYEGPTAAGRVVAAFGGFLMGGDVLIGLILFSILLIVNFMVITKGSGRIAEVAARFSLDSMPGKQMAIDADLSAGLINESAARARRKALEAESGFFGAMDGAAKFVRGDAIAGLVITAVNIFGGLAIGLLRHDMSFSDAAASFTTLTVGDGLVTQVPALLVSTAAGIVVTKGSTDEMAHVALARQLGRDVKPLALVAGAAVLLGLLPGLPAVPFFGLGAAAAGSAWYKHKHRPVAVSAAAEGSAGPSEPPITESLKVDLVRIELGYGLLALAGASGSHLTEQIKALRRSIAVEMGFILPPVRIQDNLQLSADRYVIRVKEVASGEGELRPNRLLAMSAKGRLPELDGEAAQDPVFGLPAIWIDPGLKEQALFQGCTVVDPSSILTTHLTEVVREAMPELLSYAETQKLLNEMPAEHQKLIQDIIPSQYSTSGVQRVLQCLLAERVSIRDLPTILEGINEAVASQIKSIQGIVAHVRTKLARQISESCAGGDAIIPVVTLSPEWEAALLESLVGNGEDRQLAMSPARLSELTHKMRSVLDTALAAGEAPVLLTSSAVRAHVRAIIERVRPSIAVLAQTEVSRRARIRVIATV
jgi:flagellar biosynthesis protein FlhA